MKEEEKKKEGDADMEDDYDEEGDEMPAELNSIVNNSVPNVDNAKPPSGVNAGMLFTGGAQTKYDPLPWDMFFDTREKFND